MSSLSEVAVEPVPVATPKRYSWSVFASACPKYWRAFVVFLLLMVVNAVVQPLLTLPGVVPSLTSPTFLLLALVSAAVLLLTTGLSISAALQVPEGKVSLAAAWRQLAPNLGNFALWTVLWGLAIIIGLALWVIPAAIVIILTPFVPYAAAGGQRNALKANFQAIGARKGRFVVTLIVSAVLFFLLHLVVSLLNFLITNAIGFAIAWIVIGLFVPWVQVAWALLYRSTPIGAELAGAESSAEQPAVD